GPGGRGTTGAGGSGSTGAGGSGTTGAGGSGSTGSGGDADGASAGRGGGAAAASGSGNQSDVYGGRVVTTGGCGCDVGNSGPGGAIGLMMLGATLTIGRRRGKQRQGDRR
ncbi:MAG TPA: MYXO-CTERM sorting domain-containing protein, partial [Polyangia bacterium]|nr:MYXO-CTERM sorting domain-containing protein [Polyangia bacterium]